MMKEIFRHKDITTVYFHKNEIPIPDLYPNLCVMYDEDYQRAWEILNIAIKENAENMNKEITCSSCGEVNPGNFEICFACGADLN